MKKASLVMIALTLVFMAFAGGFLIGRNSNRSNVRVSTFPNSTSAPVETTTAPTQTEPLLININTATTEQLTQLPGIGTVIAERIVSYRNTSGPFESLADLTNVEGIGDKKLEGILDYITLGGQE